MVPHHLGSIRLRIAEVAGSLDGTLQQWQDNIQSIHGHVVVADPGPLFMSTAILNQSAEIRQRWLGHWQMWMEIIARVPRPHPAGIALSTAIISRKSHRGDSPATVLLCRRRTPRLPPPPPVENCLDHQAGPETEAGGLRSIASATSSNSRSGRLVIPYALASVSSRIVPT